MKHWHWSTDTETLTMKHWQWSTDITHIAESFQSKSINVYPPLFTFNNHGYQSWVSRHTLTVWADGWVIKRADKCVCGPEKLTHWQRLIGPQCWGWIHWMDTLDGQWCCTVDSVPCSEESNVLLQLLRTLSLSLCFCSPTDSLSPPLSLTLSFSLSLCFSSPTDSLSPPSLSLTFSLWHSFFPLLSILFLNLSLRAFVFTIYVPCLLSLSKHRQTGQTQHITSNWTFIKNYIYSFWSRDLFPDEHSKLQFIT